MQTALIPDGATSLWIGLTDDGSEGVWNTHVIRLIFHRGTTWNPMEELLRTVYCSAHLVLGGTTRVQIFFLSFAKSRRHNHQEKHTHKEISVLYIYKKKKQRPTTLIQR